MATKVHHVQSLAGINDFRSLLDLIRNEGKYRELLDTLESMSKECEEKIELAGGADYVMHQKTALKQREQELKEAMDKLKYDRNQFEKNKAKRVKELEEKLQNIETEKLAVWNDKDSEMLVRMQEIRNKEKSIAAREKGLSELEERLGARLQEANKKQKEYEALTEKLKSAMNG